jgi:hypothetical protein
MTPQKYFPSADLFSVLAKPVETKTETQFVMNSLQLDERICGKIGSMNVAKPNLNGWLTGHSAKQVV